MGGHELLLLTEGNMAASEIRHLDKRPGIFFLLEPIKKDEPGQSMTNMTVLSYLLQWSVL